MSEPNTMSKEDTAFFVKTLWEALLKPDWARGDLIDLGMAVFNKTPLNKIDDGKFAKLFPSLLKVAALLGEKLRERILKELEPQVEALIQEAVTSSQAAAAQQAIAAPTVPIVQSPPVAPVAPPAQAAPVAPVTPTEPTTVVQEPTSITDEQADTHV